MTDIDAGADPEPDPDPDARPDPSALLPITIPPELRELHQRFSRRAGDLLYKGFLYAVVVAAAWMVAFYLAGIAHRVVRQTLVANDVTWATLLAADVLIPLVVALVFGFAVFRAVMRKGLEMARHHIFRQRVRSPDYHLCEGYDDRPQYGQRDECPHCRHNDFD